MRMVLKALVKYFLNGLLVLVPLALTVYILYRIFFFIDGLLGLRGSLRTGIGFLIIITGTAFVGFLASHFFTSKLLSLIDSLFKRLPLVKLLYSSIKDLIEAFVGDKKRFDKPVLVSLFPGDSGKALGFITQESLDFLGLSEDVAVYFPQSYNFAGNLLIFPRDRITAVDVPSSEVMAFLISGGISTTREDQNEESIDEDSSTPKKSRSKIQKKPPRKGFSRPPR